MYDLVKRLLFTLDAERAHGAVCGGLRQLAPLLRAAGRAHLTWSPDKRDACDFLGIKFRSRVGLAAGLDKNAELVEAVAALGFGFMEIGTVTPRPQPGNPRPRLFRDAERRSLWNRMGFNNEGAAAVSSRLRGIRTSGRLPPLFRIGVNVGKNKDTPFESAALDYVDAIRAFHGLADYFVINVSSPNTPGLRDLQEVAFLQPLLRQIRAECGVPCMIKLAPEVTGEPLRSLVQGLEGLVDGWVVSNTLAGEGPQESGRASGGWSGEVLKVPARAILSELIEQGASSVISVGGISDPAEARLRRQMGASLCQVYSGWIYEGPGLVRALTVGLRPAEGAGK